MREFLACLVSGVLLVSGPTAGALELAEVQTRHFTIFFAENLPAGELRQVEDFFESAYAAIQEGLGIGAVRPVDVIIFGETGDFTAETKLPFWSASAMIDGTIYLQPARVLRERGVLETTIRHEVCLVLLYQRYGNHPPGWFSEGLAVFYSGEIEIIKRGLSGKRPEIEGPDDIDALLSDRTDREKNRWGYVLAYEEVVRILGGPGRAAARKRR